MQYCKLALGDYFENLCFDDGRGMLTCYLADNSAEIEADRVRPSILILPGGGYEFTSEREAEPVALRFLANGYNAFVLHYSVSPVCYPAALLQACAALALIRRNASIWHADRNKLAVIGFSAGGHLAASVATKWDAPFIAAHLGVATGELRPNAAILAYPVISSGAFAHKSSIEHLLGPDADAATWEEQSLEHCISAQTPPVFLWHTQEDSVVPVQNSMLFAAELIKNNIPLELHIFPYGAHGASLASPDTTNFQTKPEMTIPHIQVWLELALKWLDLMI